MSPGREVLGLADGADVVGEEHDGSLLIAVLGAEHGQDQMLCPLTLLVIVHHDKLHEAVFANPDFRLVEVAALPIPNKLGPQIALLIAHEVVLVDALAELSCSALGSSGAQHFTRWNTLHVISHRYLSAPGE